MFKLFARFLFFLSLILPGINSANACSVCGCGDPLAAAGSNMPMVGLFRLGLEWSYLTASALSDDNNVQVESLIQRTLTLTGSYNPTPELTLLVQAPIVEKQWSISPGGGNPSQAADNTGLGDLNLGVRYFFWKDVNLSTGHSQALAISSGIYVPTGAANLPLPDPHAELGTGAWGLYEGLLYSFYNGDFNFSANATVVIRGLGAKGGLTEGYQFGNALRWSLQGQYNLDDDLALSLGLDGRYADQDFSLDDAGLVPNTGGTLWEVTPGLNWSPLDDLGLYAKIQIPVAAYLVGTQTVGPTVMIGSQLSFR